MTHNAELTGIKRGLWLRRIPPPTESPKGEGRGGEG